MSKPSRGIGPVPEGLGEPLTDFLGQLRRNTLDVLAGRVLPSSSAGGSGSGSGSVVIGGGTGGGAYEPDLTPPPTPTGVSVIAGISVVFFKTADPTFTQGHGHLATLVYGKKWSGTGPKPTFSADAKQMEFSGLAGALPTDPATKWHFWLTWKSKDGVESLAPAGGLNGFEVETGQDVSLLLQALTGQIQQTQLYASLGARIDLIDGVGAGSVNQRISTVSSRLNAGGDIYSAIQTEVTTRATQTGDLFAQYTVKLDVGGKVSGFGLASTGPTGTGSTFVIRSDKFAIAPPAGVGGVGDRTPFVVQTTDTTEGGVFIPKGVYMDAAYIINLTATYARFQSLVADDIATASLFAVAATIGTIKGTYEIRSTTYTSGPGGSGYRLTPTLIELPATAIRGRLSAGQIDGEGLEIKAGGVVLLSSSVNLDATRINAAAGWLNSNISLSPTGALSGGGGGQIISVPVRDDYSERSTDRPPNWYPVGTTREFKVAAAVGLGGADNYLTLETVIQYADATGGACYQYAYRGTTTWRRWGTCSASSWEGAWVQDIDRNVYTGDFNATYGATWSSNLFGRPANLASLGGSEALRNADITITLNADGSASISGGPSIYGGATAAGLGAVKTDLSNAPSGILNSSITLSGLGARAMAYLDYITAAAASTYIEAASITLAHIKVASIGTLSALSSFLGAVEIAVGGYLRSGQTAWGTGSGFWLGWIGSGPGEPGISIGTSTTYLRYRPSTGLEIKFDGMTASLGNVTYTNVSNGGPRDYGYMVASVSGGFAPYSYSWNIFSATMDNGSGTEGIPDVGMVSVSTNTAYFRGTAANAYVRLAVECVVTDANGRSARAVGSVEVLHGTYPIT